MGVKTGMATAGRGWAAPEDPEREVRGLKEMATYESEKGVMGSEMCMRDGGWEVRVKAGMATAGRGWAAPELSAIHI